MDTAFWPILGGMLGLVAGSFLATLVIRWPQGKSLAGRSRCDSCGTTLAVCDLVPLLSFAATRGHCRHCGAAIPPQHLQLELAAAAVGALALFAAPGLVGLAGALFGWLLLALLALDLDHFWLPDRLTLPLLALGLVLGNGTPTQRVVGALLGGGGFLLLALAYRRLRGREGLGLGDAKLMAALGAWLSPPMLGPLILLSALAGIGFAAVRAYRNGGPAGLGKEKQTEGGVGWTMTDRVPFGACLALTAFPLWIVEQVRVGG
jgi:leader peptidase (prepilin peptidase)/N-methyltransferase